MRAAKIAALIAVAILALTYSVRAGIQQYHAEQDRAWTPPTVQIWDGKPKCDNPTIACFVVPGGARP